VSEHYSPERRTALVLSGTGADGAYHAGVLRALHETGIKIDLVGGRGIGALGAVLFAVDGAAGLWEAGSVWRGRGARGFYGWRWPFRWLRVLLWATIATLAVPLAALLLLSGVYLVSLAAGLTGLETGIELSRAALLRIADAFGPGRLPTWVPRVMLLTVLTGLGVLLAGVLVESRGRLGRRTAASVAWWSLLGAPLDAAAIARAAIRTLWNILRGGAAVGVPDAGDLSRRYSDLLTENLGQPGFKELLVVVHDLDARRDMVFGLLKDPYRKALFAASTAASSRRAEAHDLAGVAREHLAEVLAAALTLPGVCPPRLVTFAADAYWRGETHRLADRPSSVGRLLEEVAAAGAEQLIVVSAAPDPPGPHALRPTRADARGRVAEHLASVESTALADALRHLQHRFQGTYVIRPTHNPLRPLDLGGAFDEQSDRSHSLDELMQRGYEDAFQQFIEPMLGASGERL
jgi:hypothetical protein